MNPGEQSQASDGSEATRKLAVKALIERYYYQLTEGCGRPNCTNENCASGRLLHPLSPNEAAARALQLFITKAQLCERTTASGPSSASNHVLNHTQGVGGMVDNGEPKPVQVSEAACSSSGSEGHKSGTSPMDHAEKAAKATNECPMVTRDSLMCLIEECRSSSNYTPLIHTLGQVYSREDCLKRSFPRQQSVTKEDLRAMEVDMDKDQDCQEMQSSATGGAASSPCPRSNNTSQEISVDVDAVRETYSALFSIPDHSFSDALVNAILILCETLEISLKYHNSYQNDPSLLNIFVILMELPLLEGPFCGGALQSICRVCDLLPIEAHCRLAHHWARHSSEHNFRNMVNALHHIITTRVIESHLHGEPNISDDSVIVLATKMMKILFMANMLGGVMEKSEHCSEDSAHNTEDMASRKGVMEVVPSVKEDPLAEKLGVRVIDCRKPVIPFEEFYNEPLSEQLERDRGFAHGRAKDGAFSFLNHAFVLTPAVKALGLYYDNRIRMYNERSLSMFQMLVGNPANPYLRLPVSRDNIVEDALRQLGTLALNDPSSLKKQLVVEFEGEQGIDEGGVSKEFFQLVVEELFNPDFAMFTFNEETQTYWFNPTSFVADAQFKLIGIILGLAIYNNIILDVHFPMVVYYKLLGKRGTYYDLHNWNPSLAQGLDQLLAYEEDNIEEVFMQTFRITYQDVFGTVLTHDLKEDGDKILVNQQNKREFVDAYADFLLNESIEKQFSAFRHGFLLVTDDSPLQTLFRPEEVELLVCGSKDFDFNALEESTEYDGGYMATTPIIRRFWELVHEFSIEQKRKLLQFATGSDRVPVGGLSKLRLVIARHGPDSDRLPTAHTCFNVLLLPEYSSKEKLQERLLKAICYSKGFGMF